MAIQEWFHPFAYLFIAFVFCKAQAQITKRRRLFKVTKRS